MPWQRILWVIIMDWVMIVTGLVGALTASQYKWGYFTFGCAAMLYIFWTMLVPARRSASRLGPAVSRCYNSTGVWTLALWTFYPIAWGLCEGGNVIAPDSEAVFYGILDVLTKIGFSAILLIQHDKIDPAVMGCKIYSLEDTHVRPDKKSTAGTNGAHITGTNGAHAGTNNATTTGRDGVTTNLRL
jgi:bacteriorhodopsin